MRECSRNRPTIDRTAIVSLIPGIPGRNAQMPRTIRSIGTPAREVRYRSLMRLGSDSPLTLMMTRPLLPART
jgi:hypothetical protein